jgi:hypothetical protein
VILLRTRSKLFRIVALTGLAIVVLLVWWERKYQTGFRLTSEAAARVNAYIGNSSEFFDELHFNWGDVYLFNSPKGPRTAVIEKHGIWWFNEATTIVNDNSDAVKTVGFSSFSHVPYVGVTVLAVQTTDANVSYIEAGPLSDRIKKPIKIGASTVFSWSGMMTVKDLNAVAYSKNGHDLYEYRFPKNKSSIDVTTDLRWYPSGGTQ